MKVWLNRDTCDSNLAACENCFGQFLRTLVPDRACILATADDGREDVTIYMHTEGVNHMLFVPAEMREIISYDGWPQYVDFDPSFSKHEHVVPTAHRPRAAQAGARRDAGGAADAGGG